MARGCLLTRHSGRTVYLGIALLFVKPDSVFHSYVCLLILLPWQQFYIGDYSMIVEKYKICGVHKLLAPVTEQFVDDIHIQEVNYG